MLNFLRRRKPKVDTKPAPPPPSPLEEALKRIAEQIHEANERADRVLKRCTERKAS